MKAEEFYKQRSNSIRELWALSPKQIEYIALIMEEYATLRQPPVSGLVCCGAELIKFNTYGYDECADCGKTYRQQTDR